MQVIYRVFSYLENLVTSNPIKSSLGIAIIAVTVFAYHPQLTDTAYANSIVKVLNTEETGGGTGWAARTVKGKAVIVTNAHVCAIQEDGFVTVQEASGKKSRNRVLTVNKDRDLCLIESGNLPTLTVSDTPAQKFDHIKIFGHPFLDPAQPSAGLYIGDALVTFYEMAGEDGKCETGAKKEEVDTFFGSITVCTRIEALGMTTVPTFPGNSGSPVTNEQGQVVGVINSGDNRTNHGAFVPLPYLKEMLSE